MPRIAIGVGETPSGELVAVYIGREADQAIAAIEAAGKKGEIAIGHLIRNPEPSRRFSFVRTAEEQKAEQSLAEVRAAQAKTDAATAKLTAKASAAAVAAVTQVVAEAAGVAAEASAEPVPTPATPAPQAAVGAAAEADDSPAAHFGGSKRKC